MTSPIKSASRNPSCKPCKQSPGNRLCMFSLGKRLGTVQVRRSTTGLYMSWPLWWSPFVWGSPVIWCSTCKVPQIRKMVVPCGTNLVTSIPGTEFRDAEKSKKDGDGRLGGTPDRSPRSSRSSDRSIRPYSVDVWELGLLGLPSCWRT